MNLRIVGMHCGGCVGTVEKALRSVPGVQEAAVQLLTGTAAVSADGAVESGRLIEAVRAAGYDAQVMAAERSPTVAADDAAEREEQRRHRQALIQAIALVLPILAIEHLRHHLWGHGFASQAAAQLMEIILLIMLTVSPAGGPILVSGLRSLVHRAPNMDLLITLGFGVATFSSVYGIFVARDESFVHVHAAAMILGLVCIGRYLEARARGRARMALTALARVLPQTALVVRAGQLAETPLERVGVGDVVRVGPQMTIPVDGDIESGTAAVDERLLTGEPMPVTRGAGDAVSSGTMVVEGQIDLRVTAVGADAAVGRISRLVQQAQVGKTQMQRLADRVAAVFTPIVVLIAMGVFAAWWARGGDSALADAARAAVAVLVVACPCALGLATPTAVAVVSGAAALRGILVRDAGMLEALGGVDVVVWDKTGTLTRGCPVVERCVSVGDVDEREWLRLAASAQQLSQHPIAKAVVARAREDGLTLSAAEGFESVPGAGVAARVEGRAVVVGSVRLLRGRGVDVGRIESAVLGGSAVAAVAIDGAAAGLILLRDEVRAGAREAVAALAARGVRSEMLTGDSSSAAEGVAREIGVSQVRAGVSPAGKVARVRELVASGARTAMVGDGINDAAALAAADVGIAFASGADVAAEAAGIQLVGASPMLVPAAVDLARRARRIIRQNLFWAFAYNVVMIPAAALGRLPPEVAVGAMMVSSLTVVLNSLRLRQKD